MANIQEVLARRCSAFGGLLFAVLVVGLLVGCGSDDEASAEDLIGTWQRLSDGTTWEITDDLISITDGEVECLDYIATSDTIELTEAGIPLCEEGQVGNYEWDIDDDMLTLTVISDRCVGRKNDIDRNPFERIE